MPKNANDQHAFDKDIIIQEANTLVPIFLNVRANYILLVPEWEEAKVCSVVIPTSALHSP